VLVISAMVFFGAVVEPFRRVKIATAYSGMPAPFVLDMLGSYASKFVPYAQVEMRDDRVRFNVKGRIVEVVPDVEVLYEDNVDWSCRVRFDVFIDGQYFADFSTSEEVYGETKNTAFAAVSEQWLCAGGVPLLNAFSAKDPLVSTKGYSWYGGAGKYGFDMADEDAELVVELVSAFLPKSVGCQIVKIAVLNDRGHDLDAHCMFGKIMVPELSAPLKTLLWPRGIHRKVFVVVPDDGRVISGLNGP
jgi:hypothetical protein